MKFLLSFFLLISLNSYALFNCSRDLTSLISDGKDNGLSNYHKAQIGFEQETNLELFKQFHKRFLSNQIQDPSEILAFISHLSDTPIKSIEKLIHADPKKQQKFFKNIFNIRRLNKKFQLFESKYTKEMDDFEYFMTRVFKLIIEHGSKKNASFFSNKWFVRGGPTAYRDHYNQIVSELESAMAELFTLKAYKDGRQAFSNLKEKDGHYRPAFVTFLGEMLLPFVSLSVAKRSFPNFHRYNAIRNGALKDDLYKQFNRNLKTEWWGHNTFWVGLYAALGGFTYYIYTYYMPKLEQTEDIALAVVALQSIGNLRAEIEIKDAEMMGVDILIDDEMKLTPINHTKIEELKERKVLLRKEYLELELLLAKVKLRMFYENAYNEDEEKMKTGERKLLNAIKKKEEALRAF